MKLHKEAFEYLKTLGVSRWDAFPPNSGKIKWFNAENKIVAEADYKVILSVGPGPKYTMAHAIDIYKTSGIPFLEILDEEPNVVENITDENVIWARAEKVAEKAGADFAYQCSTLLVAVFGLKEAS